jgi:hypothetical protein
MSEKTAIRTAVGMPTIASDFGKAPCANKNIPAGTYAPPSGENNGTGIRTLSANATINRRIHIWRMAQAPAKSTTANMPGKHHARIKNGNPSGITSFFANDRVQPQAKAHAVRFSTSAGTNG